MDLEKNNKKVVFSGVQPSGVLHLGNYLGALAQWVEMQNKYNCIFCVVDYHAITVKQEPKELSRRILDVVKIYLASGINPEKAVIFQQSDITAHTELAWILNCIAKFGELKRMTQFKEKTLTLNIEKIDWAAFKEYKNYSKLMDNLLSDKISKKEFNAESNKLLPIIMDRLVDLRIEYGKQEDTTVGLYDYPVLMAADILLYNTDLVPVGEDQVQHVELTRTLAQRFNRDYGSVFKIPQAAIRKQGARIMGLDDPSKKMSKSASSPANFIALIDSPEAAKKKIMRAVTDSGAEIKFDPKEKPAIANLLTIYSLLAGEKIEELEKNYRGKGYGEFKDDLAEVVKKFLREFQIKYNSFTDEEINRILKDGADKIRPVADETLKRVKEKLGIN